MLESYSNAFDKLLELTGSRDLNMALDTFVKGDVCEWQLVFFLKDHFVLDNVHCLGLPRSAGREEPTDWDICELFPLQCPLDIWFLIINTLAAIIFILLSIDRERNFAQFNYVNEQNSQKDRLWEEIHEVSGKDYLSFPFSFVFFLFLFKKGSIFSR